eukprot:161371_1
MFLTDPTVLFAVGVICGPLALINYPKPQMETSAEYLTHPPIAASVLFWLCIELCFPTQSKVSHISHWYLINGIFFHALLDPICGLFQYGHNMSKQYGILDKRYIMPFDHEGMIVNLVSLLELFVMAPICLYIYYGYYKYAKNKHKNKKGLLLIYS